ncbi:RAB6-interacting golgin [Mantella aurantiaca]
MAGWAGFSEDELRKLKHQQQRGLSHPQKQAYCPPEAFLSHPQPLVKKSAQQTQGRNSLQGQTQKKAMKDPGKAANSDRAESKPKMAQSAAPASGTSQSQKPPEASIMENKDHKSEPQNGNKEEPDEQLLKMEMGLKEKSRLDHLQLEQRLMEEKNKRKKALLTKAISEKSRKTQAEALKLQRIQKQLQALDDLVSTDIGILRTRIEHACIEFSQARKRYDRAESEFVAAKLDLHKKTQIKEQLTEHLCTIIQQNELRKANRLEELMKQLELEADEEGLELEIEIEQMLQRQESEARKQSLESAAEKSPNPSNIKEMVEKDQSSSEIQETCIEEKDKKAESNPSNTEQELTVPKEDSTHSPQEPGS